MATLDVLIVLAFVAYAVWQGFSARRVASQSLEEYFLAGRSLSGWKAGLSMAATQFAADTPLFVTGLVATAGIFYLWRPFWIFALAFLLLGFVLSTSWRRAGVLTDAELTEIRYGSGPAATLRGLKAVYFGVVINCAILAMVLIAATRIAEPFLLWDQWLPAAIFDRVVDLVRAIGVPLVPMSETADGTFILDTISWASVPYDGADEMVWILSARNLISILAIVAVTTLYSTTGGLRSVVATDIVQLGIMLLGTVVFAGYVLSEVGGLGVLTERIRASFPQDGSAGITGNQILAFTPSQAKGISLAVMATMLVQWLVHMYADGTGYLAQRTMACRTDADAKRASIIFTFVQVLGRSLIWLPIALGVLILFPPAQGLAGDLLAADREATFVRGMSDLLPAGILGLLLTGMLAALASTVDTHLNWGSSYLTNDIFKRFVFPRLLKREPRPRTLVWVARGSNLFILLVAMGVMTQLTSIHTAWQVSTLLGAGIGIVLVLRWLWWRMTAWGEIAAIAASLVLAPILIFTVPIEHQGTRLFAMAIVGTLAGIVASYISGPESTERLTDFYRRANPPGFWGPIAVATGVAPNYASRKLGRSVAAMLLCATTIFCLLTGLGSWMVDSPAPTWFPWRGVWIGLLLIVGLAVIPWWWRLGELGTTSDNSTV
jgi:Na+/proline symporter